MHPKPMFIDDGDYDYVCTIGGIDVPVPHWLAEIIDVPRIVLVEIFLIGLCSGLVIAASTLLLAIYFTVG